MIVVELGLRHRFRTDGIREQVQPAAESADPEDEDEVLALPLGQAPTVHDRGLAAVQTIVAVAQHWQVACGGDRVAGSKSPAHLDQSASHHKHFDIQAHCSKSLVPPNLAASAGPGPTYAVSASLHASCEKRGDGIILSTTRLAGFEPTRVATTDFKSASLTTRTRFSVQKTTSVNFLSVPTRLF